jgi:DNA-cytosine methyltransferase
MKVLSLFDGIGGARQALKDLNIDCEYYSSEIDKYAIQVAKANHSDIKHIGDVKELDNWNLVLNNLAGKTGNQINITDLLIGGSPCQDLSIAKKDRKGLEGNRSSLFYEYLRILNETKPKYFILENVASMSKESKEIITKELFNIEPVIINSALLTAQNRKRYYWVGKLVNDKYQQVKIDQPEDQGIYLKDIIEENVDEKYYINEKSLETYTRNGKIKNLKESNEKSVCLTATTHKGFGNDGCTAIRVGQFNKGGQGDRVYSEEGKSVYLFANTKTGLYAIAQRGRNIVDGKRKDIKGAKTEQRFESSYSEKANTLTTVQKDSMLLEDCRIRKLTPTECCRLQGFPDDYVSMVSNTQGYKGLGNSFTVPVIKHILQNILKS